MRVLLSEQWHLGHHFYYVSNILPALTQLVDDVVLGISPMGRDSVEFQRYIEPYADRLTIDTGLPNTGAKTNKDRISAYQGLRGLVEKYRPDHVIVPSGDLATAGHAFDLIRGRSGPWKDVKSDIVIHYGSGVGLSDPKNYAKDTIYKLGQTLAPWQTLHYVNVILYERMKRQWKIGNRARLLPDPIRALPRYDKVEARRQLGLPEDGRYLGVFSVLDRRKAIDELLAAFRAGRNRPNDRLLLAGRLDRYFDELIQREYSDLVKSGQLILIQRFIEPGEVSAVLGALDVVCIPYPKSHTLSSALLNGVAAGRPVLANDFGWTRYMVNRFKLGWTCNIFDPTSFARSVGQALDESENYEQNEATRRLLAFHNLENFSDALLANLRANMGRPSDRTPITWDWVVEAI